MKIKRVRSSFFEFGKTIFWAVLIALIFRSFLFEPFSIPSGSMIPTLKVGDYLFVSKYSYGYSRYSFPFGILPFDGRIGGGVPERGDVIVFRRPGQEDVDFIKRLIGLPGDRIQLRDSVVHLNGEPLKRVSVADGVSPTEGSGVVAFVETLPSGREYTVLEQIDAFSAKRSNDTEEFVVPAGHYFFMGDNRDRSNDSRLGVGYVPARNLIGRAEFLFFSHNGSARFWQVWKWPSSIRFDRIGAGIG